MVGGMRSVTFDRCERVVLGKNLINCTELGQLLHPGGDHTLIVVFFSLVCYRLFVID